MTESLKYKIEHSIALLKKAEKLAIRYDSEDGFFLAFSVCIPPGKPQPLRSDLIGSNAIRIKPI